MRHRLSGAVLCPGGILLALLAGIADAGAQSPPLELGAGPLQQARLLFGAAGHVGWSVQGDRLAFDRADAEGYSDIYAAKPDGTFERCLTCQHPDFAQLHAGNPAWHPSGRYLVFQVEKPAKTGGHPLPFLWQPGGNLSNDLWLIRDDGKRLFRLTNMRESGGAVHSPRFSHEGHRLAWSERVASRRGSWGQWVIRVAKFGLGRGLPRLKGLETYTPGPQQLFYEVYGFTPDDKGLILAGNLDHGQPESGLDLYTLRLRSGELRRLTTTPLELDRYASYSPEGEQIVWSSNRGLRRRRSAPGDETPERLEPLELWIMNAGDGSQRRRLTYFNDPLSPDYLGRVQVGASAWSRDGARLAVVVTPVSRPNEGELYILTLAAEVTSGESKQVTGVE